jgi:ketosteroid isomerase-like protein
MRLKVLAFSLIAASCLSAPSTAQTAASPEQVAVRRVVEQFEEGLKNRDLTKIEPLMAADLVALENGHRNDGWADFRDHHLVPEMKEPMPPSKTEIVKVVATATMGWAYTKTEMQVTTKSGEKRDVLLWSVYILEKRAKEWKIVLLDWSIRTIRPPAK